MNMKIFRWSDPISLPLTPTISGTISDYLQLLNRQAYVSSPRNCDNLATESAPDGSWHWQYKSSIRLVTTSPYQYVSTIAHRLAARSSFTPLEICQNFQPPIRSIATPADANLDLDCWYNEAGYLYFQVTAESICKWLNYIHDLPLNLQLNPECRSSASIAVYAHARCCSCLKLAATEKLAIVTDDWQITTSTGAATPTPVENQTSSENPLGAVVNSQFEHPAEQRLIQVLMRVLDSIYEDWVGSVGVVSQPQIERQRSPNWDKLTLDLAQSWLEFYRHCRIFGDVKNQNPRLVTARCGLTAIARRYLQLLLENYLGVSAAIEL
jgi:hypothetical protein